MNYQTPGLYLQQNVTPRDHQVEWGVAGFVGLAQRGPVNRPQRLTQWNEYLSFFGGTSGDGFLARSVAGFFDNDGKVCYVNRVTGDDARHARALLQINKQTLMEITAASPGEWGNDIEVLFEIESQKHIVLGQLARPISSGQDEIHLQKPLRTPLGDDAFYIRLASPFAPMRQPDTRVTIDTKNPYQLLLDKPLVESDFPVGTQVIGPAFKMIFVYRDETGDHIETYDRLSADPEHSRYFVPIINGDGFSKDLNDRLQRGFSNLVRVTDLQQEKVDGTLPLLNARPLNHLKDGSNGEPLRIHQQLTGSARNPDIGLARLERVSEIDLITIPDLAWPLLNDSPQRSHCMSPDHVTVQSDHPSDVQGDIQDFVDGQAAILHHCEKMQDRFAILDTPPLLGDEPITDMAIRHSRFFHFMPESRNGALYFPWLTALSKQGTVKGSLIPPSGHIAGIYARALRQNRRGGVPANEIIKGIDDLQIHLDSHQQDQLNPRGVNCLRLFAGRGIRVWGARTLSYDPQWRYVNVRRTYLAIVHFIRTRLQRFAFEPNTPILWEQLRGLLNRFLDNLCRNDSTLIFPEMTSHGNITLKKGLTASNELLSWQMDVAKGEFEINPRSEVNQIAIVLQDANSKTVKRWELNRVLPVKWVGPDLKATTSEIAVESLELAYESLWLSELS